MEPRQPDDFKKGIAWPILRSFGIVLGLLIAVICTCVIFRSAEPFFPLLIGGVIILWIFDRNIRPNKAQEDEARRRWFGLGNDQ